ncbi:isochorismate synthase [Pseudomonas argentinensis]|uniref:isochorismate synthase n=1 Tax=Phytopseudomonas argentinensis TaxID=289370 RepID=UPI0008A88FD9|nr:isochorismate synthase [Pseudomonas argentinensis]
MKGPEFSALRTLFEEARRQAARHGRPIVTVSSSPAPDLNPLQLYAANRQGFFWCSRHPDLTLFGLGSQWQAQATGNQRLTEINRQWSELCSDALIDGPNPPILLGGIRFDQQRTMAAHWTAFSDASFHLAHWLVSENHSGRWLSCQRTIEASDDPAALARDSLAAYERMLDNPPPAAAPAAHVIERSALPAVQWQANVERALQAIGRGDLSKVVLARQVRYQLQASLDSGAVMCRLHDQRSQSHLFAMHRGDNCFLGATPERLLSCQDGYLTTHALAGSAPRGLTPDEDQALGDRLLADRKEQHEHRLVVETIAQRLGDMASEVQAAARPSLLKLATVQHLSTPIRARLKEGYSLLEGVQALHPTPAVGGLPSATAMSFIRHHEDFDRGWYAAPVGWLDSEGNGDFLVALRSALLAPRHCHLFAGCGIVAGSVPASEYRETEIKLASMEQALLLRW